MLIPNSSTLWLFDYDLTLYGADEHYVLDSLDANITAFVAQKLGLAGAAASRLRQDYCKEFGTTLGGLQTSHGVEPHEYFDFIHGSGVRLPSADPRKKAMLDSLPGHKFVFTNARRDWAERGLMAMGIAECFEGLFDLEFCGWLGKPALPPYLKVEDGLRARGYTWKNANSLIFLDDKPENLQVARTRGWGTVLVHPQATQIDAGFDGCITHLLELPNLLQSVNPARHAHY